MLSSQYMQNEKQKHYFLLPNALFDIELHIYALAIYAYSFAKEEEERASQRTQLQSMGGAGDGPQNKE